MRSAAPRKAVRSSSEASRSSTWLRASSSAVTASRSLSVVATVTSRSAASAASVASDPFACLVIGCLPSAPLLGRTLDHFETQIAHLHLVAQREPMGAGRELLAIDARRARSGEPGEEIGVAAAHDDRDRKSGV